MVRVTEFLSRASNLWERCNINLVKPIPSSYTLDKRQTANENINLSNWDFQPFCCWSIHVHRWFSACIPSIFDSYMKVTHYHTRITKLFPRSVCVVINPLRLIRHQETGQMTERFLSFPNSEHQSPVWNHTHLLSFPNSEHQSPVWNHTYLLSYTNFRTKVLVWTILSNFWISTSNLKSHPFAVLPNFWTTSAGKSLVANALLTMLENSCSGNKRYFKVSNSKGNCALDTLVAIPVLEHQYNYICSSWLLQAFIYCSQLLHHANSVKRTSF